ncbi:MAG: heme lyase CcmF/NrfE family subunit [Rhodospirillales bacterium]|jgi:cytochrome c-type biogenesis protein CcmF|nr:heme lyase CcmF/NrfE family subunit [Rhodospirillales bacterium]MBT4005454.1 heme lyase CcmF/NrfE family subunit [Rhodospirillales bacterium]MBT5076517.1 heme lyase CcmF/NrfE family subunit [Rhodospirillales bacterium]MBT5112535.1 heme lyase CcmF/NrfE family subunit [Rhodospirillales bacterium]MBT5673264.1 heme lyase CcmF/NrfE family subunit [Rhodospirillales bacterium]
MIVEIGHYALILAFGLALVQASAPLIGAQKNNAVLMDMGRMAAMAQFLFVALAFAALTHAFVVSDFSVAIVVANSHSAKPWLYKLTGVWGNHEGSMVLWVFILSLFGACVGTFGTNLPPTLRARVLAVQGMIGVGFLLFILTTSNPFLRLDPVPADGRGLNPILQDPGLAFHPPFLYLGYVGFSVAFSFAIAALIEGRVDAAWARWVRPWTLAAWCALTLGVALGSWWAYYELGWGGFWFWDPVENASVMPWLAGTALLHSAIVVEKRNALKSWTILLAVLTFVLSLLGTFIVRSGVLTSVHSFANDPERGLFILVLLMIAAGGGFGLYALRAHKLKSEGLFAPISREGGLVLNNLLLGAACATVFIGTLYPLLLDVLDGGKVSVGPPFFNLTFAPLMAPLVAVMGVGPMLAWKRGDLASALSRLWIAAVIAAVGGIAILFIHGGPVYAVIGIALSLWLIAGAITELATRIRLFKISVTASARRLRNLPLSAIGMTIAHGAVGIMILGITASSAWKIERILVMNKGDQVTVAGYTIKMGGVNNVPGPNYLAQRATLTVTRSERPVTTMFPEKRRFKNPVQTTTEAAIYTTGFADLYIALGDQQVPKAGSTAKAGWVVRVYYNPLVPWIWIGAIFMMLGGLVSLADRRHRVGAPTRAAS